MNLIAHMKKSKSNRAESYTNIVVQKRPDLHRTLPIKLTDSGNAIILKKSSQLSQQDSVTSRIAIEISISTMFTRQKDILELLKIPLILNGTEIVPLLIADKLNRFNEFVFADRKLLSGAADRRALRDGDKLENLLEQIVFQNLDSKDAKRIRILRWQDIHTVEYEQFISILKSEFESNRSFNSSILTCADEFFKKRAFANKTMTSERLGSLIQYILWELPLILRGFDCNGNHFDTALHPTKRSSFPSELEKLVFAINNSTEYERLRKKMDLPKNRTWIDVFQNEQ